MADIVVSSKKKINLFDRVIQSVVIAVNMNKMNRAIDEHLGVIRKTEGEEQKVYQENILREIVFVKYQYDIMQREMYELKLSYPAEILDKIKMDEEEKLRAYLGSKGDYEELLYMTLENIFESRILYTPDSYLMGKFQEMISHSEIVIKIMVFSILTHLL